VGLLDGVVAIMAAYVIAAMFFSPALSITDAYALAGLRARGIAYGPVRLWGSVAFIAGNVGAGMLLERIAPGHLIWLIVTSIAAATVAAAMLVPLEAAEPAAEETEDTRSLRDLLQSPPFLAVVAAASLVQSAHALFYGFSALQWRAAGVSGPVIGALWGLGVFAEIVLFALSSRLPAALTPIVLLSIGAAGAVLRWTAMAFDPPLAVLPALQLLHAASFGATHLGTMGFLARAVPRRFAATAQGALGTVSGMTQALAMALSGALYANSGSLAYLAMAAMALAGFCLALLAARLARR
jgi:PPP family 3-phenylpropionic acid transporter